MSREEAGIDFIAFAQVASAAATVVLAVVAWLQVREVRTARIDQQRPHVIVDAGYSYRDIISVVVRNIGAGAARNISFEFSEPLESGALSDPEDRSKPFVVSDLPFLKEGIDYLAPGSEVSSGWDTYVGQLKLLGDKKLRNGFTVTIRYEDLLSGKPYTTHWNINPSKIEGAWAFDDPQVKALRDLVKVMEKIHKKLPKP